MADVIAAVVANEPDERQEWIEDAVFILMNEPFSWTAEQARSYADAIAETYLGEGYSPDEAIDEDRKYWD
jgi:hypothetical protein